MSFIHIYSNTKVLFLMKSVEAKFEYENDQIKEHAEWLKQHPLSVR